MNALFLDRDGVLNENRDDHVKSIAELQWIPGVLPALRELAQIEVPIVVVTNQSIIGRGLAAAATVWEIHEHMCRTVRDNGGRIDAVLYCPHQPQDGCSCRKPRPGLLLEAAVKLNVDLSSSLFVGDAFTDYQAAAAAGTHYIHVQSGRGASASQAIRQADLAIPITKDLLAAVPLCRQLLSEVYPGKARGSLQPVICR
ncbi:MAG: HAD-IIIA family hydrolase [Chloroflexi bacterium]|nr:HAD-IIIA family hydrolase [Chloroflexota bacterium]